MTQDRRTAGRFGRADRLEIGDPIPPFTLPDSAGRAVNPASDQLAGRPLLLVFACAGKGGASFAQELTALRDRAAELRRSDALVLAITRHDRLANATLAEELALPFPLLSDVSGEVYAACGLGGAQVGRTTVTLALDGNLRVAGLFDGGGATRWAQIAAALASMVPDSMAPDPLPPPLAGQAPVLVLPRVLSEADCARLIEVWHRPVRQWEAVDFATAGFQEAKGDFKVLNRNYGTVVQMVVRDLEVQRYLDAKLQRRVMPQIFKAFQTATPRREDYRIACYDAGKDGWLGPHRDNPTKQTRHRRFTLAVTLNAGDFEGGGLRFREYSDRGYLVPTGSAIVWSCALLHEVLPVTAGRRFILGTHLFGN